MGPWRVAFFKSIGQRDHICATLWSPNRAKAQGRRKANLVKLHLRSSLFVLSIAIGAPQSAVHLRRDLILTARKALHIRR